MAKLILSVDGTVLKEIPLAKERITLGRKPHNDIQIDNLAVSGEHAAIITILNDSFIEDLNSTNGTVVNGKPIKKHFLQNNDVVEIGKHKLKYFNDVPLTAMANDFERTMIIRRPGAAAPVAPVVVAVAPAAPTVMASTPAPAAAVGTTTATNLKAFNGEVPAASAPAVAAMAASVRPAAIQILSGVAAGRVLDLTKNLTTIGKPGVQVAVITRRPGGFFITHVEGASFPTVNGNPTGQQATPLNDHDLIEIAGIKMDFFYKS